MVWNGWGKCLRVGRLFQVNFILLNEKKKLLSTKEAAEFLSLSARTLEKHRTYGTGPAYRKLGGRVVYAVDDLEAWAARGAVTSTSDPRGSILPAKRHTPASPAHAGRYAR